LKISVIEISAICSIFAAIAKKCNPTIDPKVRQKSITIAYREDIQFSR
jgi:hypothetical protein